MSTERSTVTVLVPSYQRPEHLSRCLESFRFQTRPPDQIIVVRRADDTETAEAIAQRRDDRLTEVTVDRPTVLVALAAGLQASTGSVIAFTDDDVVLHPEWLERLLRLFEREDVGAVGGKDVWAEPAAGDPTTDVGRITRWGKLIGNHHLGSGEAREVMVLRGANMAFRREALALPHGLRGEGAQAHFEIAMSLWARKRGWRLVYDPSAAIDHVRAPRFDLGRRHEPYPSAIRDQAYNLVFCLLSLEPALFKRRALYGLLLGDRGSPGLARGVVGLVRGEHDVVRAVGPSLLGQVAALADHVRGRRVELRSLDELCGVERPKPRIALVAHDIHDSGGMERVFAELIRRGQDSVDFVVVAGQLGADLRRLVEWKRVRVPQRPFPLKFATFFLLGGRALRHVQADLVETMGAIVPNRIDIASVHFCHAGFLSATSGLPPQGVSPTRRLNTSLARAISLFAERWAYRASRAKILAAVSPGLKEELRHYYPEMPVAVTPNGVDAERFRPDTQVRRRIREEHGVGDRIIALFVGGDWDRKGLRIAVESLAHAKRLGEQRLELWVIGRGDERQVRHVASRCEVGAHVTFFGQRADTEQFYAAADVFVLPTLYEAAPLVAYEAGACELPVVATRVNGIAELVGDNEAGILVDRTPEAVAAALVRLAAHPEERARLGAEAGRRARAFTWQRSVASSFTLYDRLLRTEPIESSPVRTTQRDGEPA